MKKISLSFCCLPIKCGYTEIHYSGGKHNLINVLNFFNENNINCGRVYSELPTLNDVFLEITGKELRDREA